MKTRGTQTVIARGMKLALWAGLAALLLAPSAWALGTASGTSISNQATINYSVGGVNQISVREVLTVHVIASHPFQYK